MLRHCNRRKRIFTRLTALFSAFTLAGAIPVPSVTAETETPLPAVYIQNGEQIGNEYHDAVISVSDENGGEDITDTACTVRLRGNSSRRTPKPSYKIHFEEKVNPLSLGDGKAKTWALIGNCFDASLLRNFTGMLIAEQLSGLPYTPNCRSVELYLNEQYRGVYLLIETVSINKYRVAIAEQRDEIENNGYLLEMTCYAQEPMFYADNKPIEIKSELSDDAETAQAQINYIRQYTEDALHALQSGDAASAAQYIDIDSLVDNCLINEICKNADVGWDSCYLYKDAGGKLTFCPVWDFDIAFGNATIPPCFTPPEGENPFMLSDCLDDSNSWLCYALRQKWFRKLLKARWEQMLPQLIEVPQAVTAEAAAHSGAYEKNFTELSNNIAAFKQYPDDSDRPCYTQAAQAEILAGWIETRLNWLDAFYHSPDFDAGIFPDENGNTLPMQNELAAKTLADSWEHCPDLSDLRFSGSAAGGSNIANFDKLQLIGGQPYRLSFDCTCTASADFCVQITGSEAPDILCEFVAAGPETKSIELLFTPRCTDLQSTLHISGTGSGMVQISKLSLIKLPAAQALGDINADGVTDSKDVLLLRDWLLGIPVSGNATAGDMNGDRKLDARDLTLLKRMLL